MKKSKLTAVLAAALLAVATWYTPVSFAGDGDPQPSDFPKYKNVFCDGNICVACNKARTRCIEITK